MNCTRKLAGILLGAMISQAAVASPPLMNFSAYITEDHDADPSTPEVPVSGARSFRFSVHDDPVATGAASLLWWEEQTLTIVDGQLQVMLGQGALGGGAASGLLDDSVFDGNVRYLQIEDLGAGAPMSPRIRLASTPFSFTVSTIDGASGGALLGDLEVSGAFRANVLQLPSGASDGYVLTADASGNASWQEAPDTSGGEADYANGTFHVKSSGENVLSLYGNKQTLMLPKADAEKLVTGEGAVLEMYNVNDPTTLRTRLASGGLTGGGKLDLYNNGQIRVWDESDNELFEFLPKEASNNQPIMKISDQGGEVAFRFRAASENANDRPEFSMLDGNKEYVEIVADQASHGSHLYLRNGNGNGGTYEAIAMEADAGDGGATVWLRDRNGATTIILDADQDSNPGNSRIRLQNNGTDTVVISGAEGKVKTQVLQITGGSDLSEQFDVSGEVEPGTVVSIDPGNPGELMISSKAYDRTVAGIVSGAGGIETGMIMGQEGSIADGKHAIALTGRVYVKADASHGAIQPGDLLTTADRAGYAMKVDDHGRATGAVLGKAMTALENGQGLVLVLVGLQ